MSLVKLFGNLRRHVPEHQIEGAGDTVRAQLEYICADTPSLRQAIFDGAGLRPHVRVTVNGHDIELAQGLETSVSADDQIAVFPPIAGGQRTVAHQYIGQGASSGLPTDWLKTRRT